MSCHVACCCSHSSRLFLRRHSHHLGFYFHLSARKSKTHRGSTLNLYKCSPFPKRFFQGISLLTLIAFSDYLIPRPCEPGSILCQSPSDLQLGILYVVLALVTTGTAGTRVALASAGANQYEKPKDQGTFFNCYFLMVNTGAIISATEIVYTQDNASWKLGFGLCAAANLISFVLFISGKRLYITNLWEVPSQV